MALPNSSAQPRYLVALSLLAVYFIWGSTYLALRFGIEAFPPYLLNGIRFLVAGGVLYGYLRLRGVPNPTLRQLWNSAVMGTLLLAGGVGGMTTAIDHGIGSGVAATAAAIIPVWSALLAGLVGHWPSRKEWLGLAIGFAGVVVLVQEGDFQATAIGLAFALVAPFLWSIGSVWGSRQDTPPGLMASAIQLITGGLIMLVISVGLGQRVTAPPSAPAWGALLYLIVLGSIVAYPAYLYLLKNVRPALATSYAYVNPAVAVALGLTLGRELVTGPLLLAMPLILGGVAMVATARKTEPQIEKAPSVLDEPAPEPVS